MSKKKGLRDGQEQQRTAKNSKQEKSQQSRMATQRQLPWLSSIPWYINISTG
jgi:hypothetical protein